MSVTTGKQTNTELRQRFSEFFATQERIWCEVTDVADTNFRLTLNPCGEIGTVMVRNDDLNEVLDYVTRTGQIIVGDDEVYSGRVGYNAHTGTILVMGTWTGGSVVWKCMPIASANDMHLGVIG